MKIIILLSCLFLAGCSSVLSSASVGDAGLVSQILDKVLPPDFTGSVHVEHTNVYFDFTIDADGLKRGEHGWTWTSLRTKRHDRFSSGSVVLGKPATP